MNQSYCVDLSSGIIESSPFYHFSAIPVLKKDLANSILDWFEKAPEWTLTETDFYEQFEFSLLTSKLPVDLKSLISDETVSVISGKMQEAFHTKSLSLVGAVAHKLMEGQKIGIHNDFINGDETHRLVIHINSDWKEENGGFLMLFNSSDPKNVAQIINPLHNSAFAFEISRISYHAVSKVYGINRYTIVYTFKAGK